jgi:exopolysaccharide biosynthesis protein
VTYRLIEQKNPPNRIHIVTIDLQSASVQIVVAKGGADDVHPIGYETSLLGPLAIAERDHLDIVINGDFFEAKRFKDAKGTTRPFAPGDPANVRGAAESNGVTWAKAPTTRPALIITHDGHARIQRLRGPPPSDAEQVISGSSVMLQGGKLRPMPTTLETALNPRTAVGISGDGKTLILLVDDGRWKDHSVGMSTTDLAKVMLDLGCTSALNLDGGGSTEMALRDPATGQLVVVNHPSEGHERPVANVLGILITGIKRVAAPVTQPSPANTR